MKDILSVIGKKSSFSTRSIMNCLQQVCLHASVFAYKAMHVAYKVNFYFRIIFDFDHLKLFVLPFVLAGFLQ